MESKEKYRVSLKGYLKGFTYAKDGLVSAYKNEQSMTIHFMTTVLVVILCIVLKASVLEWAVSILLLGLIAGMELINTSLEAVIDLISPKIHPLAKVGKDTASAAVFVFAITAVICGLLIFVPNLLELL